MEVMPFCHRRPPTPDPWEPQKGSWARTLRVHSASGFPLGILHSPLRDMRSQDKHSISHCCLLMTWPMVFPRISSSRRQVLPLLTITLHSKRQPGPTHATSNIHLHDMPQFPFPPQGCRPFHHESTIEITQMVSYTRCPARSLPLTCHVWQGFSYLTWKCGRAGSNTLSKGDVRTALMAMALLSCCERTTQPLRSTDL